MQRHVESNTEPISARIFPSFFRLVQYQLAGAMLKMTTRELFHWDNIKAGCLKKIDSQLLCDLVSKDSGPDFIQAFVFSFGSALALESLLPDQFKKNPEKMVNISALMTLGFIALGELIPVMLLNVPIEKNDLITETLGMLPAYLILRLANRKKGSITYF